MSSTGTIYKRTMAPTTSYGEELRETDLDRGVYNANVSGQAYGLITAKHPEKMFIKADAIPDQEGARGTPLGNGKWIPLMHSASDIASAYGEVKTGMMVLVNHSSVDGANATATIIADQGENWLTFFWNTVTAHGSFRIFQ